MKQAISHPTDKPWWRSARWQNGYLLATWLLLSAMPLLPLAFGRPQPHLMQIFVLEALAWVIAWAALARPRYFQILLLPAFIALPIEIYLQLFFAQGISENSLGIILETSPGETLEFLGSKIYLLFFIIAIIALWFGASMRWAWQSHLQVSTKVRVCLLWLTMLLLGSWVYNSTWAKSDKHNDFNQENTTLSLTHQPDNAFKQSWPFGIYRHLVEIIGYRYNIATLAEQNSHFRFGAYSTAPEKEQVIVLVLGESSRADRWSLNGYSRATNPLLQQENNLVNFPDFISPVTATRLSVPIIISRKPVRDAMNDEFAEKSLISAFKEAGYKTWWVSNQIVYGQLDNTISVMAKEADVTTYVNLGGLQDEAIYDQEMLPHLKQALRDSSKKKLIILHTIGNHWNYARRHPANFNRWQPSLTNKENPDVNDLSLATAINNSYDNSVLYADWFLNSIIGQLRDKPAAMFFVADHGETLPDGNCQQVLHMHNFEQEFRVPAMLWYADSFQRRDPAKINALKTHAKQKLSTENVMPTLLELGDVSLPQTNSARSIVNSNWAYHQRLVYSYDWNDFDHSISYGACREIMEKGSRIEKAISRRAGNRAP